MSRLWTMLRHAVPDALLDLVWPRPCEICGQPAGESSRHFCWDCLAALPVIESPYCSRCGDPVEGEITRDYVCSLCVDRRPAFDLARSALRYRGGIKEVLHRFKYSQAVHLGPDLAMVLETCARAHYDIARFDAVAYVPLFPARERDRTYNQARLLAGRLADALALPLARGILVRIRETGTQTKLNLPDRARNVKGAFEVIAPEWVEGRSFLLVDDVMTTGATVSECSRALKAAGALDVCVVTVARG